MKGRSLLLLGVTLAAACASAPDEDGDTYAPAIEAAPVTSVVARALAASLEPAGGGVMEDGLVRRRVAALAAEVAQAARRPDPQVTVLDTTDVVLRALPGNRLQVSRGLLVACAGGDARGRVATLLAHAILHLDEERGWPADAGLDGVAPIGTDALAALVAGARSAVDGAAALGRLRRAVTVRADGGPCRLADQPCAAVLTRLGVRRPEETIHEAYAALAEREARDGGALAPFVAEHGTCAERVAAASGGTVTPADRAIGEDGGREPLDLSPLVAQAPAYAALDAAELLVRRGAAERALKVVEDVRGARALTVRGEALAALGRDREAERAYRSALLLDPGAHAARVGLGALYAREGQREAARAELLEALRRAPLDASLHLLLSTVEEGAAARVRLDLARALDPDGPAGRWAAFELAPRGAAPAPPERDRLRILMGSGRGDR